MVDNQTAQATCGNIFNFVIIASERMREIYKERKDTGLDRLSVSERKHLEAPHLQVAREITSGTVGIEYLKKIRDKARTNKQKMR